MGTTAEIDVDTTGAPPRASGDSVHRRIAALARTAPSRSRYIRDLLPILGEELGAFYVSVHLQLPTEVWRHEWNDGSVRPEFWRPAVEVALTEALAGAGAHARLFCAVGGRGRVAIVTAPLRDCTGARLGAVSVLLGSSRERLDPSLAALRALADYAGECTCFLEDAATRRGTGGMTTAADRALRRASEYDSSMELAFAIANQLQAKSEAVQVSLGEVRGRRVRVRVISGQADVKHNSPGVIRIRQALEECLDVGTPIVEQADGDAERRGSRRDHRLHRQWREASGGDAVLGIPLASGGQIRYVVGIRRRGDAPFGDDEIAELRALVEPYAAALDLLRRAERRLGAHVAETLRVRATELAAPGRIPRKVAAFALVAAFAWFLLGTTGYSVSAPARVLPAESRSFSAPEDGRLRIAPVAPGDFVRAGDLLCAFDDRELRLEESRLRAELSSVGIELHRSLAADDRVAARLAQMRAAELGALLDLQTLRISALEVRAPFAGEITGGDLRERVGDTFAKGEPLFEMASEGGWRLEIDVPESRLDGLDRGHAGVFASFARPDEAQDFALAEIPPATTAGAGGNVFKVRAELADRPVWLRAGMEGVARVEVGPRRVAWVALHDLLDWLHLNYWF